MAAASSSLSLLLGLLGLLAAGTSLPSYPLYAYPHREAPPPYPAQPPPAYLIYPHVYRLQHNATNATHHYGRHDFVFGSRSPEDRLLLHSTVYKRPGIWSSYASKEITFPPPGSHMRVNITQVTAYDRGANGTGGFVKLVGGGVGRENVTLLFRSQKNLPIHYELDIYGMNRR